MSSQPLDRRTVLRGLGTAMALPFLDAMLPAKSLAAGSAPKVRHLAFLYVPNGIHMPAWTPEKTGKLGELPPILQPLDAFKRDFSVFTGFAQDKARPNGDGPGDHARAAAAWLTGVQPLKDDGKVQLGISADQVAAQQVGERTRFRSINLATERGGNSGQCDSGYACAYSSNISWRNETTPAGKEVNPRQAFDRLFRGGDADAAQTEAERRANQRSVLDYVGDEARKLRKKLGGEDRAKLDQYFDGVRELERQIEHLEDADGVEIPDSARPPAGAGNYEQHATLLFDVLALAFQSDATRIATYMLANEGSNRAYRNLGINGGHHGLSHHGSDAENLRQIQEINTFHVQLLARFLERLKDTKVPGGNLLDSAMIVYGSCIGDGNRHNHDQLPTLLIGHGHGSLNPGRHERLGQETPLNNLYLALLREMGCKQESLGDSTGVFDRA